MTNKLSGFMIYELHKSRLHIINFAVHAEFRRRRIGTQMITKLIGKLSHQRRTRILLGGPRNESGGPAVLPVDGDFVPCPSSAISTTTRRKMPT